MLEQIAEQLDPRHDFDMIRYRGGLDDGGDEAHSHNVKTTFVLGVLACTKHIARGKALGLAVGLAMGYATGDSLSDSAQAYAMAGVMLDFDQFLVRAMRLLYYISKGQKQDFV